MNPSLTCRLLHDSSACRGVFLILLAAIMGAPFGCDRIATTNLTSNSSNIRVVSTNASVVLTTSAAEFQFLRNGYLQASLLQEGSRSTLDDSQSGADSEYLESDGKQVRDFNFNLLRVATKDISSGPAKRGKHVEIVGKSASLPSLQKTVALEAYDDLPNVIV